MATWRSVLTYARKTTLLLDDDEGVAQLLKQQLSAISVIKKYYRIVTFALIDLRKVPYTYTQLVALLEKVGRTCIEDGLPPAVSLNKIMGYANMCGLQGSYH